MAGYDPAKAARMNALAQQYPNASLSTLATLARVSVSDLGNYTNDSVGTKASNANFGRVTSEQSQNTQSTNTARNSAGSGSAFAGNDLPTTTVSSVSSTPSINPFTGRAYTTPPTPVVTSPTSSQNNTNTTGSAGSQFAFSDVDLPPPSVTTPTPRPSTIGAGLPAGSRGSGEFLDTRGRAATPQPDPFPAAPPARPVQAQDDDVDFTDAYGDSYTEVTPIPPSTRRPGVEQAQPFQPPQSPPQDYDTDNELPGDDYDQDFRTADDIARANRADVPTPTPRPDINAPEPPPARPAQEISQVDDFSGTGITEVDDFSGPSRNVTPVDDFAEYQAPAQVDDFGDPPRNPAQVDDFAEYQSPAQVDDFAEINTPAQVDDFDGYSNNDFGTEDPGLDAFGPGPAPAQVDDFAEYQPPAQVDDFGEINTPAQVDDFADYSDNDFGTEDPGLDAFGPGPAPAQVDDFADYSDNDFGAQVDDFGDPTRNPAQVDDFADYSDDNFGEEDFSDFATTDSPSDVNQFGVDDFGDPEAAQFDEFGDPLRAPAPVAEFDEFGDPINPQVTAEFDEFGDPIDPAANRVDNDGESLVGDDPDADIGDGADGEGIDGVEQAALSNAQTQAINAQAMKTKAQNQQTISEMREASGVKNADGDWRVKLRLAPQADYLYKAQNPGILAPLAVTDGIIFPYTPTIDVQYRAEYNNYQPTHSNYMHYFYKGSSVQTVQLQAEFTAQDTKEAEYLLACMHFLKSASKMFYGQDAQRGSPPPLLYLTGLGEYQFNEQPCVVSEFNLNLPSDVNYIRARSRHINRDDQLQFEKPLATATTNGNFSALNRLKTAVTNALNGSPEPLQVGAKPFTPSPGNLGSKGATYVPTKMSMTINLLPIASRQQVSQQFSLKEYANGNLIKKGMW